MPDMERPLRSLELHLAKTPEEAAFLSGKHAGMDKARWQIAKLVMVLAVVTVVANVYFTAG